MHENTITKISSDVTDMRPVMEVTECFCSKLFVKIILVQNDAV